MNNLHIENVLFINYIKSKKIFYISFDVKYTKYKIKK